MHNRFIDTKDLMASAKFYEAYSRFNDDEDRFENWEESVDRVMDMHKKFYKDKLTNDLLDEIEFATNAYKNKKVLGAQRALQFGGDQILNKHARAYNCSATYVDRPEVFGQIFWVLLCGAGVGLSVQKHHIEKLPKILPRTKQPKAYVIEDSIEGWASSLDVLMASFFEGGGKYPEYAQRKIYFDYSKIRPKGAFISGGFKAPGPEGLRDALNLIENILNEVAFQKRKLKPIEAYDIVMHSSDAVLSGGVRRCLPSGSLVHTKYGMKAIENVEIGELVLTSEGYHKVSNKFDQGIQNIIEVVTQDSKFKCTPNHKIAVLNGIDTYEWKMAQDLKSGDRIIAPSVSIEGSDQELPSFSYDVPLHSTTCKEITIPKLDTDIAWLLGLIQGDGYVRLTSKSGEVSVSINNEQTQESERAKKTLERFGVNVGIKEYKNYHVLKVKSKQLASYFYSWLKQPKTELKIPDFIWNATYEIKMSYVSGIMDADGSVKTRPAQILISIYENYVRNLQILLSSCGIQTRIKKTSVSKKENWKQKWALVVINTKSKEKINDFGFKKIEITGTEKNTNSYPKEFLDFSYPNNYSWSNTNAKLIPVEVKEIINLNENAQTWDIEVEEKHEFFCNGYLVHNSATIVLFSLDDEEMMKAKTGNWFIENPQRGRSNNSVVLLRDQVTKEQFTEIFKSIKEFGEPGFAFFDSTEFATNPCVTGDTLVLTSEGIKRVDELLNKPFNAIVNGKEYPSHIGFVQTGIKEVYKITAANGNFVKVTNNHKILVNNGEGDKWIETKYLTYDDHIVCGDDSTSKIVDIEAVGVEPVYDCRVEEVHRFEANGLIVHNCFEIGLYPQYEGISGFEFCNLTEINGGASNTEEEFYAQCKAASILGTLQAGYTDFGFLGEITKKIVEREALLGVSITGFMNNPAILLDEKILRKGARIVKETNRRIAKMLGINPAARTTCVKPSGNASVLLSTASGIHGDHSKRYIRNVQMNKMSDIVALFNRTNPHMVEESVWSKSGDDVVLSFPSISKEGSIYKKDLYGVKLLEKVKLVQQSWVEEGTNVELCVDPKLRHNVSNTISVDDWDSVEDYLFENKEYFAGVSMLPASGDKDYAQAPFTEILDEDEIINQYGAASLFASGLIVDALSVYNNLWTAIDLVLFNSVERSVHEEAKEHVLKNDWNRRFVKYANTYFDGDLKKASYCLKDVFNLHKWYKIQNNFQDISWEGVLKAKEYVDINQLAASACVGVKDGEGCSI